jgi:hypothetical protein
MHSIKVFKISNFNEAWCLQMTLDNILFQNCNDSKTISPSPHFEPLGKSHPLQCYISQFKTKNPYFLELHLNIIYLQD